MDLSLKRLASGPDGIFGQLRDKSGDLVAWTLEHAFFADSEYSPAVPFGSYVCIRGLRRLKGALKPFETFEIADVPGHSGILFHSGNLNSDSEGCVLLGTARGTVDGSPGIVSSRIAFAKFMAIQEDLSSFQLEIS